MKAAVKSNFSKLVVIRNQSKQFLLLISFSGFCKWKKFWIFSFITNVCHKGHQYIVVHISKQGQVHKKLNILLEAMNTLLTVVDKFYWYIFVDFITLQSVAAAVGFAYSSVLNIYFQLGILMLFGSVGALSFFKVQWKCQKPAGYEPVDQ